jgi:hypothetical protein
LDKMGEHLAGSNDVKVTVAALGVHREHRSVWRAAAGTAPGPTGRAQFVGDDFPVSQNAPQLKERAPSSTKGRDRGHPLGRGSNSKKRPVPIFSIGNLSALLRRRFKVKLIRACYFFCSISERPLLRRSVQSPIWFWRFLAERGRDIFGTERSPSNIGDSLRPDFSLGSYVPFMAAAGCAQAATFPLGSLSVRPIPIARDPENVQCRAAFHWSFKREMDSPLRFKRKCAQPVFDSPLGRIAFKALSLLTLLFF